MVVRKVFFLFLEKNTQKTPQKNTQEIKKTPKKTPQKNTNFSNIPKKHPKKTPKKNTFLTTIAPRPSSISLKQNTGVRNFRNSNVTTKAKGMSLCFHLFLPPSPWKTEITKVKLLL